MGKTYYGNRNRNVTAPSISHSKRESLLPGINTNYKAIVTKKSLVMT